jgi:hypothetical protein
MEGLPQFRVNLGGRVYKGTDIVLFGKRDSVNETYFVPIHFVPFSGPVGVIVRTEGRVPGGLCKKHRRDAGLFAYIKMEAGGCLLFYYKVFAPKGQILAKGRKREEAEEENEAYPLHTIIIGRNAI